MVLVTEKQYYLDGFVKQVGDAVAARVQKRKQDILMLFGGQEGSGKSNAAVILAYYISTLTGRPFSHEQVFFQLDDMIEFAGSTEEQIIIWDEAALGGLASDWTNYSQRKLKAMLMICRKKRHVFIFCIPRFYRLNSDIIERAYCLFQIYENAKEEAGNFMFFGRDGLEWLFQDWKVKRRANYWKFKKLHGHFVWLLPKLINEAAYEAKKDAAILALAQKDKKNETKDKLSEQREKIYENLLSFGLKKVEIADMMGVDARTLRNWREEWEKGRNNVKTQG